MSRVAVVTGGGSGMGRAICRQLAERGHRISVLDIDGDAASAVAAEITGSGGTARAGVVDVSDRAAIETASTTCAPPRTRRDHGDECGHRGFTEFLDITPRHGPLMAVNLTGTFHCLQAAVPDMIEAGWGRIVTISSSSAQSGTRRMSHYVASKGGVIAFTKALALDLARHASR